MGFHRFTFLLGFLIMLFLIFYWRKAKKNIQNLSGGGSNDSVLQVPSKNYTDMVEFLHTSLRLTNIIRKIKRWHVWNVVLRFLKGKNENKPWMWRVSHHGFLSQARIKTKDFCIPVVFFWVPRNPYSPFSPRNYFQKKKRII